jgi:hypothetical protein
MLVDVMNAQKGSDNPVAKNLERLIRMSEGAIKDVDRFRDEILEQVIMRKKKHMMLRELKEDDLVRERQPEALVMQRMQQHLDQRIQEGQMALNSSDDNENYLKSLKGKSKKKYQQAVENDSFEVLSKDDYRKLKAEIQEKKEAKAKLLKQGFPELKNYVYL